jgi:hypothetical protein
MRKTVWGDRPIRQYRTDGGCSRCGGDIDRPGKYCKACHAAYMRKWRPKHSDLAPEAKKRATARAYANVYLRRGKLERQPCEVCGVEPAQMHHDDHDKPLEVRWFCRQHHLEHELNKGGLFDPLNMSDTETR